MQSSQVACAVAAAVLLHGCGVTPDDMWASSTATTTTTTREPSTNIWQFRNDEDMGPQTNYDVSQDSEKSLYGACWKGDYKKSSGLKGVETLAGGQWINYGPVADQFAEASVDSEGKPINKTYGTYNGEVGVTLFNKRNTSDMGGCLMRKTRLPVDLSTVGRMELDITTKGSSSNAPWYSVWLAPMLYSGKNDATKAAEIDLIENYDWSRRGTDSNMLKTTFAQCGQPGKYSWTKSVCKAMNWWGEKAGNIHTHITVKAVVESGKRVLRVYRCTWPAETCDSSSQYAEIKVESDPPTSDVTRAEWFPVWNKALAGDLYGHYWLVADIWWTSDTDFELSVGNVKFFLDDESEWMMPLDGPSPLVNKDGSALSKSTAAEGACCGDQPLDCCTSAEGCCPAEAAQPFPCCEHTPATKEQVV